MSEHLSLTVIDYFNDRVHVFVADYRKRLKGCHSIDLCADVSEAKGGYAQNGTAKERVMKMASSPQASASRPGKG
jgi:hypothetical protein